MKSKIIIGAMVMMAQHENANAMQLTKKSSGIFSSMIEVANAEDTLKEQKAKEKAQH